MKKLTLESVIKHGKEGETSISEMVNVKGKIFSLIKEGYEFDDEVLEAAHITKIIRNEHTYCMVRDFNGEKSKPLPKDSVSIKQIISELNTISKSPEKINDDDYSSFNNEIDTINFDNKDD